MSELAMNHHAKRILSLIDLTSLNNSDNETHISQLCRSAITQSGHVAAICIYPQFIAHARKTLNELGENNIKIATVVNFPDGQQSLERVVIDTLESLQDGADEIDLVIPYKQLISGQPEAVTAMVSAVRRVIDDYGDGLAPARLKVIIESGELKTPDLIKQASEIAITSGADMIKTSTGKVEVNATPEAADIMLDAIKRADKPGLGFKAAGGIRTVAQAKEYLDIADKCFGGSWSTAEHFRFGASSLLADVLATLNGEEHTHQTGGY